jgi:hypothetical protein
MLFIVNKMIIQLLEDVWLDFVIISDFFNSLSLLYSFSLEKNIAGGVLVAFF